MSSYTHYHKKYYWQKCKEINRKAKEKREAQKKAAK
jgi:hypothetical protein